jgi:putative oxidoreductase
MDKIVNHQFWRTHALLIARILMGALFIVSGVTKLNGGIDGTAMYIESAGLPAAMALAWLAAILEVVAGAAIVLGYYFREAALALAVFVIVISFPFHGPATWETDALQQGIFLKNMAIAAGLLFMAAHGAGNTWSLKLKS